MITLSRPFLGPGPPWKPDPMTRRVPGRVEAPLSLAILLGLAAAASVRAAGPAPPEEEILGQLMDEGGWTFKETGAGGVRVLRKTIRGQRLYGWKGIKETAASPDAVLDLLVDLPYHMGLDRKRIPLIESVILARRDGGFDFFQLIDIPGMLGKDRFWFSGASVERDAGGRRGHHFQRWWRIDGRTSYPSKFGEVRTRHPDAIEVEVSVGAWELLPAPEGGTRIVYRVFSDPGGAIPDWGQNLATGKTLPDNLNAMDRHARKRSGL